jgi:predicted ATPase
MASAVSLSAAQTQLNALVSARVLREVAPGEYSFSHALTHDAVYSTVLHRERRQAHHAVADTLVGLLADSPQFTRQVGDLAYHYERAEDWTLTLNYARAAGDEALAWYAPREAIAQYSRALHAARRLGRPPEAEVLRSRAAAHETLGDFDAARADYELAVETARAAANAQIEWQALLDLGLLWAARPYSRAGGYF